jgi:hypothetical protein
MAPPQRRRPILPGVPRAISRCPNCREPVSQFAAGCAVCGTDLRPARAELEARRARRPQLPGGAPRLGDDALRIGVTVLAAAFSPLMGAVLAGYFAYDAERDGRALTRNVMIGLLALSLVGLVAYAQIWGGLFFGI